MRILLDENFPADFAKLFVGHKLLTVHGLGWSGIKNGELLRRASEVCEVFVTLDRNLEFQQNIKVLPFGVVVVRSISNRTLISPRTSAASLLRQAASDPARSRRPVPNNRSKSTSHASGGLSQTLRIAAKEARRTARCRRCTSSPHSA